VSFHHLDQFAHIDSVLTRRPPTVRLLGTVILALGAALLPLGAWPQLAALGLLVVGLAALARIRPGPFLARFLPPFAFVVLVSAGILVLAPGVELLRIGPVTVTDAGLLRFSSAMGRAAVALGAAVILVSTTPFTELLDALRSLRVPATVTTPLALAYRYLYTLKDEVERLRRAARSRNAAVGAARHRTLLTGITAAALHRSLARSERVYQAMLSRGYDGTIRTLHPAPTAGHPAVEVAVLALVVALISASGRL
jgi:cobalt/nickel transport system permease protein